MSNRKNLTLQSSKYVSIKSLNENNNNDVSLLFTINMITTILLFLDNAEEIPKI